MAGQKIKHSVYESLINVISGLTIAILVNYYIIFPMLGLPPSIKLNLAVTLIMTIFSVIRSFLFMRLFNWLTLREAKPAPSTINKATTRKT